MIQFCTVVESTLEVLTKEDGEEKEEREAEAQTEKEKNGDVRNGNSVKPVGRASDYGSDAELRPMISLCLAYAANIGGTGSLIGTPPNLLLADALEKYDGQPINFLSWMGMALPQVGNSRHYRRVD